MLLLGLRLRYRMSQREVAKLLASRGECLAPDDEVARSLSGRDRAEAARAGWAGDDLMRSSSTSGSVMETALSADHLASLLPGGADCRFRRSNRSSD